MAEIPFFFPNDSYKLFGVLHQPADTPRDTGFVFCAPFVEEKLWSHRVFVNFARELAARGYPVLRFDYMGHGDSEGDFEHSTIETRLSDIRCAIKTLYGETGSVKDIRLLGLRFGATLACLAAEGEGTISHLILWEPIINGASYMKDMLRSNLSTQSAVYKEIRYNTEALIQRIKDGKTVNVDGYEMASPLYEQTVAIDLLDRNKNYQGRTLLVQISRKKGDINKNSEKLRALYKNCDLSMTIEEPFWKEIRPYYSKAGNLFGVTLNWLEGK